MPVSEDQRVSVEKDVVYGTGGGRDLHCDVYTPPGIVKDAPCVILVHGGGWVQGDRNQLAGYGILLGRAGYVCVAPEYRLIPESPWPAQIHDVKAVIRWTRANAAKLGIDPDRIAIEGNSAGAHLALLAAGTASVAALEGDGGNAGVATNVKAVIAVYPPTGFNHGPHVKGTFPWGLTPLNGQEGTDDEAVAAAALASPTTHVAADFPPTMLIHGTGDQTVPVAHTFVMYETLVANGIPVELHVYAEQPHAFDAVPAFGRQTAAEMQLFLSRYL